MIVFRRSETGLNLIQKQIATVALALRKVGEKLKSNSTLPALIYGRPRTRTITNQAGRNDNHDAMLQVGYSFTITLLYVVYLSHVARAAADERIRT